MGPGLSSVFSKLSELTVLFVNCSWAPEFPTEKVNAQQTKAFIKLKAPNLPDRLCPFAIANLNACNSFVLSRLRIDRFLTKRQMSPVTGIKLLQWVRPNYPNRLKYY